MSKIHLVYPEKTVFTYQTAVQKADLSEANHLGFDSLVTMLRAASTAFFTSNGLKKTDGNTVGPIYADLAVQYVSEGFLEDAIHIDMAIGDRYSKGFDLMFRITKNKNAETVALAKIGIVFYDYDKQSTVPAPENFGSG
jgi:acyl-CoA thioester hydrolase